jgi:hypothetical protein
LNPLQHPAGGRAQEIADVLNRNRPVPEETPAAPRWAAERAAAIAKCRNEELWTVLKVGLPARIKLAYMEDDTPEMLNALDVFAAVAEELQRRESAGLVIQGARKPSPDKGAR